MADCKIKKQNDDKPISYKIPTEKLLEQMIIEEEKIRQSKEYQDACTSVADEVNGWLRITGEMQRDLVKRFGFEDEISQEIALNHLRTARYLYPKNEIFRTVPVYVRNNRANVGKYKVGDLLPNIDIHNIDGEPMKLYQSFDNKKPTVILCGSHT